MCDFFLHNALVSCPFRFVPCPCPCPPPPSMVSLFFILSMFFSLLSFHLTLTFSFHCLMSFPCLVSPIPLRLFLCLLSSAPYTFSLFLTHSLSFQSIAPLPFPLPFLLCLLSFYPGLLSLFSFLFTPRPLCLPLLFVLQVISATPLNSFCVKNLIS